jgi:hypothetical protein
MNISFRKIARGPGWERWLVVEDQRGDSAFAGEIVITYADTTGYAEAECDVLCGREMSDEEIDQILNSVMTILSGEGNITIFTAHQVICKGFSLLEEENHTFPEAGENEDEE